MARGKLKNNNEVNKLLRNKNIISYIKVRRLIRFDLVHRITNDRTVKKLYEWKQISTRFTGRPKIRWENVIKECLRIMNYVKPSNRNKTARL